MIVTIDIEIVSSSPLSFYEIRVYFQTQATNHQNKLCGVNEKNRLHVQTFSPQFFLRKLQTQGENISSSVPWRQNVIIASKK
jgi:hypothetical protein